MKVVIDRFEEDCAVVELEDLRTANIARAALPPEARENDVIDISIDREETERRKQQTDGLLAKILKKQFDAPEEPAPPGGYEKAD